MNYWLCSVCETENTYKETKTININNFIVYRCKLCSNYNPNATDEFENNLEINKRIDCILPRHSNEIIISHLTLIQINYRLKIQKPMVSLLDYIRSRLYYRTFYINKRWRRKICYKRFLKIIIKYVNHHNTQIEPSLILQYLITDY